MKNPAHYRAVEHEQDTLQTGSRLSAGIGANKDSAKCRAWIESVNADAADTRHAVVEWIPGADVRKRPDVKVYDLIADIKRLDAEMGEQIAKLEELLA